MPLTKYFGLVGSSLFLLLIGTGWFSRKRYQNRFIATQIGPLSGSVQSNSFPGGWSSTPLRRLLRRRWFWSLLSGGHKDQLDPLNTSPRQRLPCQSRESKISQSKSDRRRWPWRPSRASNQQ